jgi:hypothetical protein
VGHGNGGCNTVLTSLIATDLFAVKASNFIQRKVPFYQKFKIRHLTILVYSSDCNISCWPEATFYFDLVNKEFTTAIIYLFSIIVLLRP